MLVYNLFMKKDALSSSKILNAKLALMGIFSYYDALFHLPCRYEDYTYTKEKDFYSDKERLVVLGKLEGNVKVNRFVKRSLSTFFFVSKEGSLFKVEAWNRPYLSKSIKRGEWYSLIGYYDKSRHSLIMGNILKGEIDHKNALKPIYRLLDGISNHSFVTIVNKALINLRGNFIEPIPFIFRKKYRLDSIYESLRMLHQPESKEDIVRGIRSLKYLEALKFCLKTSIIREENQKIGKRERIKIDRNALEGFISSLPYSLTSSQRKALREILDDMDSPNVMYRLLQGDVGSGKTLVAALCSYASYLRNEQAAILAPTDALAKQHYETLKKMFENTDINITLLTGTLEQSEKKKALREIKEGKSDIIVGTHALFSEAVEYRSLGFVVIDEQHKFGVNQRTALLGKGEDADLLLMSATPIPRTLALTLYGDLSISSLTEFPSGKRDVTTHIMNTNDKNLGKYVEDCLSSDHRMYVVVPKIEEGEDPYTSAKRVFKMYQKRFGSKVTILHGSLSLEEKERNNLLFRTGECPILVATSLIEVGIDVKEANLMLVYSPSSFSLSSLHQLRGRIGRDGSKANFILLNNETEENDKLDVLLHTLDGFEIAEADLRLRGPGEIAGLKQSGLPDFSYVNPVSDVKIFQCTREDAKYINEHYQEDEELFAFYQKAREEEDGISIG